MAWTGSGDKSMNKENIRTNDEINTLEEARKFLSRKVSSEPLLNAPTSGDQTTGLAATTTIDVAKEPTSEHRFSFSRPVDLTYQKVKELTSRDIWLIFSGVRAEWFELENQPLLWDWLVSRNARLDEDKGGRNSMEYCELMYTTLMHHHRWVPVVLPQDLEDSIAKVRKALGSEPWDFDGFAQLPALLTLIMMIDAEDLEPDWHAPGNAITEKGRPWEFTEKGVRILENILVVIDALNTVLEREESLPWEYMDYPGDPTIHALNDADKAKFESIMERIAKEKAVAAVPAK
jgi:hypothetical protein